ncbi:GDSL esterase/lipase [Striga asiatica]|uniref:GDSL esterase/lipase n=1 Tax=Striga asiatica TaxID=4170 RepID=A0A5A7P655_STRAF|nr:GDSL esterase/lipase [Striga asiatica]
MLIIFSVLALFVARLSADANTMPKVTAMYVFGDSLIDNGNNIPFVNSVAKAKYWPYGIDYEKGPNGRFCNGKILVDYIGELLGLPLIPSYADTNVNGESIMYGVNYASAGSGILEDTGNHFELQKLGLRKFFIAKVAPIGCIPNKLGQSNVPPGECESKSNNFVQMFNSQLKPLVNQLNSENPGLIFTLGDCFEIFLNLRANADAYGEKL